MTGRSIARVFWEFKGRGEKFVATPSSNAKRQLIGVAFFQL